MRERERGDGVVQAWSVFGGGRRGDWADGGVGEIVASSSMHAHDVIELRLAEGCAGQWRSASGVRLGSGCTGGWASAAASRAGVPAGERAGQAVAAALCARVEGARLGQRSCEWAARVGRGKRPGGPRARAAAQERGRLGKSVREGLCEPRGGGGGGRGARRGVFPIFSISCSSFLFFLFYAIFF
jgi:hypothetical protein